MLLVVKIYLGIRCRNCTWLLNTSRVNLIEKVLTDFPKNVGSSVPLSVTKDVVPYFYNKPCLYTGDYCL